MKKIVLYLLFGVFSGLTIAAQPSTGEVLSLSLVDCIELAYKNNYNRQSVILNESANQEVYKQSKMERLPYLNATIGETYTHSNNTGSNWSGNYSLNTGVTVYQGGYINNTIEKKKLSAEQSKFRTSQFENDLTIQVLQAFLTALGNEELLRYQNAVLKASDAQVKQGKVRFETGDILKSDYLLLESQFANDQNNTLETTISRDNSLNILKNLMSLDLSQAIEITYPHDSVLEQMGIIPSEAEVVSRSIETLPDLRISDYNVEIAKAGVLISRSAYSPSLSLKAGIGSGHINDFDQYGTQLSDKLNEQIGFTLSIPIFNNGRTKSNVAQSRIALQQAELERKQTELDVRQTLIQEYRSVVLAESKFKSSEIRQNAYFESFQVYQTKFEQGSITAVELLQQQNNYINVMNDYIQSKYGFMLKRKVLDVYMGNPVTL
ncbi:MAG: TolC family protein [Bacteroidales bacterium]|nr:TolC family protein [Bacteroidales bacterium]